MTRPDLLLLAETAATWGLPLTVTQLDQFATYTNELQRWNERINLTAITEPKAISVRHFLDSLYCALFWGEMPDSLIDIGSGAGFPGVPLKLLRPELRLTLVESVGKKAAFLEHLVGGLGLEGVTVLAQRAEEVGRDPQHRAEYAVVTARAVADLRVLAEYCLPLLRVGGRFLAPKGADVSAEVAAMAQALQILGGELLAIEPVTLPGVEPRSLVVCMKVAPTPPEYPRAVGLPARRPLK